MTPHDNLKAEEHLKIAKEQGIDKWSTNRAEVNDKRFKLLEDQLSQIAEDVEWIKCKLVEQGKDVVIQAKKNALKPKIYLTALKRILLVSMLRMKSLGGLL